MKKLLTLLLAATIGTAIAAGTAIDYNVYTQSGIYPLAGSPASVANGPSIGNAPGTLLVVRPNNGIYPTQVQQTGIYLESGNRTIMLTRNRNESLVWSSWFAVESGSN